jgi:drug/metabolite transporter (DMT)-like permease
MGNNYSFKAGKLLDMSISSIISQVALIIAFVGSLLIFNENLTIGKIFGVVFILSGNLLVVGFNKKQAKLDSKGVFFRILASVIIAIGNIIDGQNSKFFPLSFYVFFGYFFGGVINIVLSNVKVSGLVEEFKSNKWGQIGMAVFASLGYFLFLTAFKYTQKSIAIPVSYAGAVIAVVMGIFILKEKNDKWRKLFAVAIVFIGSVLLSI